VQIALGILLALAIIITISIIGPGIIGACWLPTPTGSLKSAFEEAGVRPGETIMDIGCGDGRVLISAAKLYNARGIGVEIDPLKVFIARYLVNRAGFSDSIRIIRASAMRADLKEADIVFVYLSHQLIDKLKPKFLKELKPGARIISYGFLISGFPLVKTNPSREWFIYKMGLGRNLNKYS
jgi:ribosomal protein L11 methylase PrmA